MSDFQISSLQGNQQLSVLAQKCDVNNDGILDDNEYSVFTEGKDSMNTNVDTNFYNMMYSDKSTVTIGGVKFNLAEIDKIQKNKDGAQFDNTVRFTNGMVMKYDVQDKENNATAYSSGPTLCDQTLSFFNNFKTGDGLRIEGTKYDDSIDIENSTIGGVIGYGGEDSVFTLNSKGYENQKFFDMTLDGSMIFAENFSDHGSKNLYQYK